MPLLNRKNHPPQGYSYYSAQTKWRLPGGQPFDDSVRAIIKHRLANPSHGLSTNFDAVAEELDTYTCSRLRNDPRWCTQKKTTTAANPSSFPRQESAVGLVERAKQVKDGMDTLVGWLGHGLKPVTETVASNRARVCLSCPLNVKGGLLEKVTGTIGSWIKKTMALKEGANLSTIYDDQLDTCDACGCQLKLKVWVPADEIKAGMTPEMATNLAVQCWIRAL
jgi:hypothetical protein